MDTFDETAMSCQTASFRRIDAVLRASPDETAAPGVPPDLIRVSVGHDG